MSSYYILIFVGLLLVLAVGESTAAKACAPRTDHACPTNWSATSNPRVCLRYFREYVTANGAAEKCEKHDAIVVSPDTREMEKNLEGKIISTRT
ncbi:hypothetical protein ElyMa_006861600 [Elysia marginata]|uniref:C-type lectin domain-containing protein n=1 Tax=Elysia marginata TaxID=1093978 RepID=A0AAV4JDC5_9GAST|nr:hypothetical protein ElyMa_006861600 [Elysia marginata]